MERRFRNLKEETVWLKECSVFKEAKRDIESYIHFYNTERPHLTLDFRFPVSTEHILPKRMGSENGKSEVKAYISP
ncbi:IS3 family transposase [Moorella stamsii]|uniref:IS3 family transposase n=1 Tax=Neomoorella stamsii TaxID=1266720 RepID=UPI003BF53301